MVAIQANLRVKYVPHRRPQGGVVSLRDSIAATIDGTDSARDVAALDTAKRKRGGA